MTIWLIFITIIIANGQVASGSLGGWSYQASEGWAPPVARETLGMVPTAQVGCGSEFSPWRVVLINPALAAWEKTK